MKKILYLIPVAFTFNFSHAQTISQPTGLAAEQNLADLGKGSYPGMVFTYDNRYEGVKGTPFFFEEWSKATITIGNKLYDKVEAKYNVYENNLLFRNIKGSEYILSAPQLDEFTLQEASDGKTYTFKKITDVKGLDPKLTNKFFAILHEGEKTQLALLAEKTFFKADFKGGYSSNRKYDELETDLAYFFIDKNKTVQKVKLNKKALLKVLNDKEQLIDTFIKQERLDVGLEADWAKVLTYYDTLK